MNPPQAHARVASALRKGTLVRQPCDVCGQTKTEAHHDDYDRPLDVRWLCRKHHKALHYPKREPMIVLRADITRAELKALKALALEQDVSVQALLASMIRERLAA